MMERPFLRDIIFYLIAGFWAFYIFWRQEIRLFDAVGFLALYGIYLVVVLIGRYVNTKIMKNTPYVRSQVCLIG